MKRLLIILLALLSALVLTGCATRRQLQVVERTSVDTVYLRDVSVEYRYRPLRDTIYKVQHDSIPYQVTVTEVKEITRPLSLFDHLTHFTFWLVVGALLLLIIRVIIRLKKSGTIR